MTDSSLNLYYDTERSRLFYTYGISINEGMVDMSTGNIWDAQTLRLITEVGLRRMILVLSNMDTRSFTSHGVVVRSNGSYLIYMEQNGLLVCVDHMEEPDMVNLILHFTVPRNNWPQTINADLMPQNLSVIDDELLDFREEGESIEAYNFRVGNTEVRLSVVFTQDNNLMGGVYYMFNNYFYDVHTLDLVQDRTLVVLSEYRVEDIVPEFLPLQLVSDETRICYFDNGTLGIIGVDIEEMPENVHGIIIQYPDISQMSMDTFYANLPRLDVESAIIEDYFNSINLYLQQTGRITPQRVDLDEIVEIPGIPQLEETLRDLTRRIYGLPVEVPKRIEVEGLICEIEDYDPELHRDIIGFFLEPLHQIYAGPPGTENRLLTGYHENGSTLILRCRCNPGLTRIEPPL